MNGQHVLITGGSSGIGKATAKLWASRGANIAIMGRDPVKLEQAQAEILASCLQPSQQVMALSADVSDRSQAEQAMQTAMNQLGTPDVLITCAGIAHPGYFNELPIEIFEQTMAINYFGSLYCIKAVLPAMEKQRRGHLVLVSSGAGLIGIYGYTPYSPSKFALRGLAEALRGELKVAGIGISIVYPPDTDTPQLIAENRTKPPETKRITATAKTWSAEAVAQTILAGIDNRTFIIAPGQEMSVLARLHSVLAPGLNWYFDRIVSQTRSAGG
jgi:3-dehydrosphinganine reductase